MSKGYYICEAILKDGYRCDRNTRCHHRVPHRKHADDNCSDICFPDGFSISVKCVSVSKNQIAYLRLTGKIKSIKT